jgi:hypothetical protein
MTFSGVISDERKTYIVKNLLPVTFDQDESGFVVTVYHDYSFPEDDTEFFKYLTDDGGITALFNTELASFRSVLKSFNLTKPVGVTADTGVQAIALGNVEALKTFAADLKITMDFFFADKGATRWKTRKRLRFWSFIEPSELADVKVERVTKDGQRKQFTQRGVLPNFLFAEGMYAKADGQTQYLTDDLTVNRIRVPKSYWAAVCYLLGLPKRQGMLWEYMETTTAGQGADIFDDIASLLDRIHYTPYPIASISDPVYYVYANIFLFAAFDSLRKNLRLEHFKQDVKFVVASTHHFQDAGKHMMVSNTSLLRAGFVADTGSLRIKAMPIGSGSGLRMHSLMPPGIKIDQYTKVSTRQNRQIQNSNFLPVEYLPLAGIFQRVGFNFSMSGLLNKLAVTFERNFGIKRPLEAGKYELAITPSFPWSLALARPDDASSLMFSVREQYPVQFLRYAPETIKSLLPAPEEGEGYQFKHLLEGYHSIYSGVAYPMLDFDTGGGFIRPPRDAKSSGEVTSVITFTSHVRPPNYLPGPVKEDSERED